MVRFTYYRRGMTPLLLDLRDPDWVQDFTKIKQVKIRRSMSNRIRTYVVHDRKYAHSVTYTLRFPNIHRAEAMLIKQFAKATDGHYVYFSGIEGSINATVSATTMSGSKAIHLENITGGTILVGDTLVTRNGFYIFTTAGSEIEPALKDHLLIHESVAIAKQQMVIITNQEVTLTTEGRANGYVENEPSVITDFEDERYVVTLSLLVIKIQE